jgi:hypothetical protein
MEELIAFILGFGIGWVVLFFIIVIFIDKE